MGYRLILASLSLVLLAACSNQESPVAPSTEPRHNGYITGGNSVPDSTAVGERDGGYITGGN